MPLQPNAWERAMSARCWAKLFNQNFIRANLTSTIAWATVWSAYPRADNYGGIHDSLSGDGYW